MTGYFGKYRGTVSNNDDPEGLARVQVSVPHVLGEGNLVWAMPSLPYAGPQVGLYVVPPVDAHVWVEFEEGNSSHPIYAGCFWAEKSQVPLQKPSPTLRVLQTDGVRISIDDTQGGEGVLVEIGAPIVSSPLTLRFDSSGIELKSGSASIQLENAAVKINGDALKVL